jgi:hypothetical protein
VGAGDVGTGVGFAVGDPELSCGAAELPHPDSVAVAKRTARPIAAAGNSDDRETIRVDRTLLIASSLGWIRRLVLRAARLFLLRWAGFVARARWMRSGPGGHVRLGWPRATGTSRFYLERKGCCALRRNGALQVGSDLLDPQILCGSLLALVSRPLRHVVLVWDTRHLRRMA